MQTRLYSLACHCNVGLGFVVNDYAILLLTTGVAWCVQPTIVPQWDIPSVLLYSAYRQTKLLTLLRNIGSPRLSEDTRDKGEWLQRPGGYRFARFASAAGWYNGNGE
ncbi:hypothetical protein KQX54_001370 [Cotesia glomerata]|uniref:Uncharacterized protein n=1 Tax=Cotesia glomerata TaxID=32391 RepID=A0AAV7IJ56_COTGL|nr:hypothetical protein KQX54_001370 [Cotesia glomerata]